MKLIHSQLLNILLLLLLAVCSYFSNKSIDAAYNGYVQVAKEAHKEGYNKGYDKGWMDAVGMCLTGLNRGNYDH